jgi:general secretion pathway protein E
MIQCETQSDSIRLSLVDGGNIEQAEWDRAVRLWRQQEKETSLPMFLVRSGTVSELDMSSALSDFHKLPVKRLGDDAEPADAVSDLVSPTFLKNSTVVPLGMEDNELALVMADPGDSFTVDAISLASGKALNLSVGLPSEIDALIERHYGEGKSQLGQILETVQGDSAVATEEEDAAHLRDLASEAPVVRLVNLFFRRAQELHASDIHLEPFENRLKLRYRVDGILQGSEAPPLEYAAAVISRIKLMAKLNIAERRLPQDGRIRLRLEGKDFDVRVSTVPTMHGESVVMRLLNRNDVILDLNQLGFDADVERQFGEVLKLPHGLIVVTGPTGSGKSTTLYTALNMLNSDVRKLITVEDPVEYELEGINQIQVKPSIDLTFSSALRSIVRQDPDVIMVGEMRDLETARICVQSALTGHLVMSTVHTNSAAGCITRMLEMGVDDFLLASTLNAVVGQRLLRLLCTVCREEYTPLPGVLESTGIDRLNGGRPTSLFRARGCELCHGTGFAGRVAIIELLMVTDRIRQLALKQADEKRIQKAAIEEGMQTMFADGCSKVLAGITSIDEVTRVTQDI